MHHDKVERGSLRRMLRLHRRRHRSDVPTEFLDPMHVVSEGVRRGSEIRVFLVNLAQILIDPELRRAARQLSREGACCLN